VKMRVAVRSPVADGLKVMLIVHFALPNSRPHLLVCTKSPALVPETAMPVMLKAALPTFVNVAV